MAIHIAEVGVSGTVTGVVPGALRFIVPMPCRLNKFYARIDTANSNGDLIFDLNVNGVTQYPGTKPRILANQTKMTELPAFDLAEGDLVTIDVDAAPLNGVTGLYVLCQIQDAPTVSQYIKDAFQGAYNRQPTGTELTNNTTSLQTGCAGSTTLDATKTFFDALFTAAEYTNQSTNDTQYITDLYESILGRPPDPGGLSFWVTNLGSSTRALVREAFNASVEHVNARVTGWCPNALPRTDALRLQGRVLSGTAPTDGQTIVWDNATSQWKPRFPTEVFVIPISDETTPLTTGTAKTTFRMPYAFKVLAVRASVTTAPTGSTAIFDINEGGLSILGTKLSIDASEKTSTTAASAATITDPDLADDAEITIDTDQVGSTIAGAGGKIYIIGHRV